MEMWGLGGVCSLTRIRGLEGCERGLRSQARLEGEMGGKHLGLSDLFSSRQIPRIGEMALVRWRPPMCRCHLDRETGSPCDSRHASLPPVPAEQGQRVAWGTCFL